MKAYEDEHFQIPEAAPANRAVLNCPMPRFDGASPVGGRVRAQRGQSALACVNAGE